MQLLNWGRPILNKVASKIQFEWDHTKKNENTILYIEKVPISVIQQVGKIICRKSSSINQDCTECEVLTTLQVNSLDIQLARS